MSFITNILMNKLLGGDEKKGMFASYLGGQQAQGAEDPAVIPAQQPEAVMEPRPVVSSPVLDQLAATNSVSPELIEGLRRQRIGSVFPEQPEQPGLGEYYMPGMRYG